MPLVSVITPTWQRHDVLLGRCIPSVQAQTYVDIEHLIVSDGPDPYLAQAYLPPDTRLIQLDHHDPRARWGHRARLRGIAEAEGLILAWLDDDDAWRPEHLAALVPAVPEGGFAYSRCMVHSASGKVNVRLGDGPLAHGRIVPSSMLVHERRTLELETWRDDSTYPDWDLVRRWVERGVPYVSVDEMTVDHYPSGVDVDTEELAALPPLRPTGHVAPASARKVPIPAHNGCGPALGTLSLAEMNGCATCARSAAVLTCLECGHAVHIPLPAG